MSDKPPVETLRDIEPALYKSHFKSITLIYADGTSENFSTAEDAIWASRLRPVASWHALVERDVV